MATRKKGTRDLSLGFTEKLFYQSFHLLIYKKKGRDRY